MFEPETPPPPLILSRENRGSSARFGRSGVPLSETPKPPDYTFTDSSLTRPLATKVFFARAFRWVPRWLTANFITLMGFASTLVMFLLALTGRDLSPGLLAVSAFIALLVYVVADHLDGMQALASDTASELGEFLDHFLDCTSGTFVAYVCFELMPGLPESVRASVLILYLLAFIITYQERADHGRLHFARWGALEGIIVVSTFLLTSGWGVGRGFWNAPLLGGLPGYWIIVAVAYASFGGTVVVIAARMGRIPLPLLAHATASAILGYAGVLGVAYGVMDSWLAWALLTLHGAAYLARVMQPHLFSGRPPVDLGAAAMAVGLLAAVLYRPDGGLMQGMTILVAAYLAVSALYAASVVLWAYRRGWVWVNPPETDPA